MIQLALCADGTVAAVYAGEKIVIVEVPTGRRYGELELDPLGDGESRQIAWLGMQLLVLARFAAHSEASLVEPTLHTIREIAELRIEIAMALVGSVGDYAMLSGADRAIVIVGGSEPAIHPFPSRVPPTVVGGASDRFLVAGDGSIQEWDAATRKPKRRLRVPRGSTITAVGGSARLVWTMSKEAPARIDVLPLVNRNQPKLHELPEPIARIYNHASHDLVACIGESGRIYLVDLDRSPAVTPSPITMPDDEPAVAAALVHDRRTLVVATASGGISCFALDAPRS